jgi:hypothetical protein
LSPEEAHASSMARELSDEESSAAAQKLLKLETENRRLQLDALRVPQLEDELDTARRRHEQLLTSQQSTQRAVQELRSRISDLESQLAVANTAIATEKANTEKAVAAAKAMIVPTDTEAAIAQVCVCVCVCVCVAVCVHVCMCV